MSDTEYTEVTERKQFTVHAAYAPVMLAIIAPIMVAGFFGFLVYVCYHWTSFVSASASIFNWLVFFLAACLYVLLAYFMARVLLLIGRGVTELYRRFVEARAIAHRRALLHTADNYVVYLDGGKIRVHEVTQEKHIHHTREVTGAPEVSVIEAPEELEELPAPVQPFRELIEAGVIQSALSQGRMLLGYTGGQFRYGSWLDLYSCGIGGVSGSGKTTTVRFLLFQAILAGARLVMIDPHIEEQEESLAAQFRMFTGVHIAPPCNDAPAAVLKRIRWLEKERQRRKLAGVKTPAIILVVDEYNAVMRVDEVKKEMSALLLAIAQEGRKFGLFAMLIGQRWSHQDIGGADIRTSLASTLAHRFTDEEQAKKLVGSRNGARCLELSQGHYLFRDTQGALSEMITPLTTMEDSALIQSILNARAGAENTDENTEKTPENTAMIAGKQGVLYALPPLVKAPRNAEENTEKTPETERQDALQEKMLLVARLHSEGKNKPDIIRAVWNVSPGGSAAYEQANTEYQEIMRRIFKQIGA